MKHYRLLNDLAAIEQQLTQMVKGASGFSVEQTHATWSPPVDIYENPSGFVLTAEVPGMSLAELDVKVVDDGGSAMYKAKIFTGWRALTANSNGRSSSLKRSTPIESRRSCGEAY